MRRLVISSGAVAILCLLLVTTADASTSYVTRLPGSHGAARVTSGGPNTLYLNAKKLTPGTWSETLYRGTCAKLSTKILGLPSLTVGASGSVARTNTLTSTQARLARTGVVRLVRRGVAICASFATATAVVAASPSTSPTRTPSSPTPMPSGSTSPSPSASSSPGLSKLPIDLVGNGNGVTPEFQAPSSWKIGYVFDCTNFGQAGTFSIQVFGNGKLV